VNYAQTNLQLYNQMRRAGYGERDLEAVHHAYELATRLFTGKYRGSGKPLLSHLVGTASVLCALGAPAKLLVAAVLHAAYIFGEFGDGRPGATEDRRELIRRVVGSETEDLLARYHALEWRPPTIEALYARVDSMSPDECEVLLVRLANELEDHLDLGVLYCRNASQRREIIARSLHLCTRMASRLGYPTLAGEFNRVFDEVATSEVPDTLRHTEDYTYMLAPSSMMPRPAVLVRTLLDRHPKLGRLLHPLQFMRRRAA
jgi:(p)ppGpp synthase/HD superfamily hydrolase